MSMTTHINLLGHCDKCDHFMSRNVRVSLDEETLSPCACPECGNGTVHFEKLAVHHRVGTMPATRLVCPGKDTFKRMRNVFQWGLLATGAFVMLACGLVLHYGGQLTPGGKSLLIGGLVVVLAALWIFLSRWFDRASSLDWENAHGFLPED